MTSNPRRILIIEDDPDGRADLRKMILSGSDRRYEFSEAERGATALKQVQENANTPFDCILLEYQLPDLDAQEMLAAICDGRDLPPSPIVVLTGSDREVGRELLRGGAQDYLGKGWITPESLTRAIENAIDRFAMLTKQRKNEVALRESDEKFRSLLESAPDAMVIADPSGQIVLVNAATLRMFGYTRSELIGVRVEMLIPSSARERHVHLRMDFIAKPLTRTMGKGQPLIALRKDGSEFPVEIALSPIALESSMLISSSIRDISDRITNAKAIEESESRLMLGVEVAGLALAEVDYTTGLNHLTTDAARLFGLAKSDERWDIIFDVSGKAHYMGSRAVLKEGGHFISTEPSIKGLLMTILTWPLSKSGQIMLAVPSGDDLRELIRLYEAGKLKVTIDSTFPFEQAAQAHRRVESGVDHGKVVLVN